MGSQMKKDKMRHRSCGQGLKLATISLEAGCFKPYRIFSIYMRIVIHDLETCYWTTKGIAILQILCPHRKTVERRSKPLGACSFHGLYGLRGLAELFGNWARLHADRFSNAGFCSVAWVNQKTLRIEAQQLTYNPFILAMYFLPLCP